MSKSKKSKHAPSVMGKEEFGFTVDAEVTQLNSRLITVKVAVGNAPCKKIFHLTPKERLKARSEWIAKQFQQLIALPLFKEITQREISKSHASFTATLMANQLPKLLKEPGVWYVSLLAVEGFKKKKQRPRKSLDWYAVKGIYAIQVEGWTKGMQSYEERILLVRATSFDEAEKKAWEESENYVEPYLNPNGEMVRWQLEKIVDVFWTYIEELNPNGTEVFSALHQRRMKPEYEWHPRGIENDGNRTQSQVDRNAIQ